jgi:hypothetical protein
MSRSAILLCAGFIAATCFACAPPPPPTGVVASAPPARLLCDAGNPQSFVKAVTLLTASYTPPESIAAVYQPPTGQSFPWSTAMSSDLLNAFSNAPMFFRQQLCQMSAIFIDASDCANNDPNQCGASGAKTIFDASWGFRSRFDGDYGNTYIAISGHLWRHGGPAMALHDYETKILRSFPGSGGARVYAANPDNSWMTVMAALAHEAGHVFWNKTVRSEGIRGAYDPGSGYDFHHLTDCKKRDFFASWAYDRKGSTHKHLQPKDGWRGFAERANDAGERIDHTDYPSLDQLGSSTPPNYALFELYQPGEPWASLFAAQTPDEDFVETYVMAVLTGYQPGTTPASFSGPLTSLPLEILPYSGPRIAKLWANVPSDLLAGRKESLAAKMSCLPLS